jgi:hypothetical protein
MGNGTKSADTPISIRKWTGYALTKDNLQFTTLMSVISIRYAISELKRSYKLHELRFNMD